MKKMNDNDIFAFNFGENVQGREGVTVYERTSHPSRRKDLTFYGLVADLSKITWTRLIHDLLRLIPMSNKLGIIIFELHSISSSSCCMNEKYTCMQ